MSRAFSRARRLALALVLLLVALPLGLEAQGRRSGSLTVSFLDVGQGDSVLIQSPEGKTALVDSGTSRGVVDTLKRLGVKEIDLVVVSHHHSDHYGGMDDVVKAFHPKYFLATKSGHVTSSYKKLLRDVHDEGITALFPDPKGARILKLGSVNLIVLPQPPEDTEEENDNSIGMVVSYGTFSVLLTGDSEEPEREWWLKKCPDAFRDIPVIKLAHHGSRNGTNAQWLDLVKPELAVASLGSGNDYGHPHRETVELLKKYKIPFLRTDQRGTITIQSDGRDWDLVGGSEMASRDGNDAPSSTRNTRKPASSRDDFAHNGSSGSSAGRVNLNTASASEIAKLPGIGSSTARDIIAGRPYRSVDELLEIDGLGQGRVDQIRSQVTVK